MRNLLTFFIGSIFGTGIAMSGMANPAKVINFFDVAGTWVGLTQSLAKELGPSNIRVNAILPGIIEGDRMENVIAARAEQLGLSHDDMKKQYLEKVSLRRMTPQKDIATMALFLLSVMGENLSGQSFGVDGNVEAL